jgi:hypothetical protein
MSSALISAMSCFCLLSSVRVEDGASGGLVNCIYLFDDLDIENARSDSLGNPEAANLNLKVLHS